MKFCMVKKLIIVNTFVLHTLQRNSTHSAIISYRTTQKKENLKCDGGWKRANKPHCLISVPIISFLFFCPFWPLKRYCLPVSRSCLQSAVSPLCN